MWESWMCSHSWHPLSALHADPKNTRQGQRRNCTNFCVHEFSRTRNSAQSRNTRWHKSVTQLCELCAPRICVSDSHPRVAPAQVRTQDDLLIWIYFFYFMIFISFFVFFFILSYCIIKSYIHQLLAGVGRALFHGSGEELGKMIRRASTLCPDNLVLPWKKGKIWENGQKAIFLEFRVFAPWAKGVPWDGQKRPFLGGKGGGAGGGVLGLRRHIYTLSRGKWGGEGGGRGGGSKKDLEKFRGGRGGGLAGGRVGPRGDPQIHQNPKRSKMKFFFYEF